MLHSVAASVDPKVPFPTLFARAGFKRDAPDLNASRSCIWKRNKAAIGLPCRVWYWLFETGACVALLVLLELFEKAQSSGGKRQAGAHAQI